MTQSYVGNELALFSGATNWKRYVASELRPYLSGRVLEVGAGIGSNLPYLNRSGLREWVALEPDPDLAVHIPTDGLQEGAAPVRVIQSDIGHMPPGEAFDTILYIDVLEHIADDAAELRRASHHLRPGGRIVLLSPAHSFLFSAFDQSIGHHRRYTALQLREQTPPGMICERTFYLDAAGLLASLANRLFLSQSLPTAGQIAFWDRVLVRISRVVDRLLFRRLGKSVVAIWTQR